MLKRLGSLLKDLKNLNLIQQPIMPTFGELDEYDEYELIKEYLQDKRKGATRQK